MEPLTFDFTTRQDDDDDDDQSSIANYENNSREVLMNLEPTPLGPSGVLRVVDEVSEFTLNSLSSYIDLLRPLILQPSKEGLQQELAAADKKVAHFNAKQQYPAPDLHEAHAQAQQTDEDLVMLEVTDSGSSAGEQETPSSASTSSIDEHTEMARFRSTQLEQWWDRCDDLVNFRLRFGHCIVPLEWRENPSLSHWIKRQRCQHRLKREGKHSTMTQDRERALEKLDFIWDSHRASWEEKVMELKQYKEKYGDCYVPSKFPENHQLAIWVKCQRRQFKIYTAGKKSNLTLERVDKLKELGFVWDPRLFKRKSNSCRDNLQT